MAEIIINKEKHECAPAVAAYVKELDRYNKALLSDIAKKLEEIAELKAENARLEELYQKSVGVIAATDCVECKHKEYINDVNYAISCIRDFCKNNSCLYCRAFSVEFAGNCKFRGKPRDWENLIALIDDGGAENDKP